MPTVRFILVCFLFSLTACKESQTSAEQDPTLLLDKVLAAHGNQEAFYNSVISFSIDGMDYELDRSGHISNFKVTRKRDTVINVATYENGFITTYKNGIKQDEVEGINRLHLRQSFDGIVYTLSFPFSLTQNHVILKQDPDVIIRNKSHHVLHVRFTELEDQPNNEFYLYIDSDTFRIAYMAENFEYSGQRNWFSRNHNFQEVEEQLFYDSYRFRAPEDSIQLSRMYQAYNRSSLLEPKLRTLENINVKLKDSTP